MIGPFPRVSNRLRGLVLTLCAGAALAGCTHTPPPNLHPTARETALIPPTAVLRASDEAEIPLRLYPATAPHRATILALHGFGDSRDAWEVMAPTFARAGITLVAPDIRGFGGTAQRGNWSSTARLMHDLHDEIAYARRLDPTAPLYLMGESMGGAIALLGAAQMPDAISGTILLAPAAMRIGQPWQTLLGGIDTIAPDWTFDGSDVPGHRVATDNPDALRRMYFDPLTLHGTSIHPLYGLTRLMRDALDAAGKTRTPLLLIFGGRDQFVTAPHTARLIRSLPQGTRLDELPHAHHLISRDRRGAARDIVSWITDPRAALPSGGDIAAALWIATAGP